MDIMNILNLFNLTDLAKTAIQSAAGAGSAVLMTKILSHAIDKRNKKDKE
jgi:hypothetical protein